MAAPSWEWRKNYRVWEANRKVFLFPENWIEPEERLPSRAQFAMREVTDAARVGKTSALLTAARSTTAIVAGRAAAADLGRNLYRIDLSRVVSKWIGETEKTLELIFAAAATLEVVLLFDEADALLGKRSDTEDDDNRDNAAVEALLQRIEAYPGLVILATNWKASRVKALRRRVKFTIEVP